MITLTGGLTVGELLKILKDLPKDKQFLVASDEEQNTVYKGLFIEHYKDCVLIAGLSGCEKED